MAKTWRQYFAPKIAAIIADCQHEGKSLKETKKILCEANPGLYGHHRKTWANEYMRQLGLSKKKSDYIKNKDNPKQLTLI